MAWQGVGLVLSIALAAFAFYRSRVPGGFYDAEVYGMTARTHLRYSIVSAAFAILFAAAWILRVDVEVAAFAGFALVAIFYLTSFLRGAHEDDG